VVGECVHRATSLTFCEAQVLDEDGELVATASGTFKIRKRAPAPDAQATASPDFQPQA
jgi:acyl-coenzyme A thioesterase PaaI-like protein